MTGVDILQILQEEIHSTVVATVDENGYPQTCVIDMMLADENGLYFLTAKGKAFYERLMKKPFVALSGMKGTDTMSTFSISVRGHVQNIGKNRLSEIFEKNPYMAKIYPSEKSREAWRCSAFIRVRESILIWDSCRLFGKIFPSGENNSIRTGTGSMP